MKLPLNIQNETIQIFSKYSQTKKIEDISIKMFSRINAILYEIILSFIFQKKLYQTHQQNTVENLQNAQKNLSKVTK